MGRCCFCHAQTTKKSGLTFHRFPNDPKKYLEWIKNIPLVEWKPTRTDVLCSKHFKEDCFDKSGSYVRLNLDAVPTVFNDPQSLCVFCKRRKCYKNGISFFRFPVEEPEIFQRWCHNMGKENWELREDSYLCSQHFEPSCFKKNQGKYFKLKKGSVPTIFNESFENIQNPRPSSPQSSNNVVLMQIHRDNKIVDIDQHSTNEVSMNPNDATPKRKRKYYCITDDNQTPELNKDDVDCEPHTPKTKRIRLSADHDHHYIRTPRTMEKIIAQLQDERMKFDAVIKSQNRVINSLREKLTSMSQLIKELEDKHMVSRSTANCLETISDQSVLEFIQRAAGNGEHVSKKQYAPSLRSFALTLHYYSPKAYNFVRNKFNKALPCPGVLRSWYNSIDGNPGFTEESFIALKRKVEEAWEHEKKEVLVALMFDEISIKKGTQITNDGKIHGFVNFGVDVQKDDNSDEATNALVMMVVNIDGNWKLPIGYFLINGITGDTNAELITNALIQLHNVGVTVVSLTMDGPNEHFSAVKLLGATFNFPNNISPHFPHPITGQHVYVLLDPCHMLKLIRNTFHDYKVLIDEDEGKIDWVYIRRLADLQEFEGVRAANKLRRCHVEYFKMKMKVYLAAQTLSQSVAKALELCLEFQLPEFQGCEPTIKFIQKIDVIFDFLNSRNPYANGYKAPLKRNNEHLWRLRINDILEYIVNLRCENGTLLCQDKRKTGFLGMYSSARSIINIFDKYVKPEISQIRYLLTYKFSQDHLELLFCGIRARGGSCDNPTCAQFISAYKRMLIHHEIKGTNGNVTAQDNTNILTVTSKQKEKVDKWDPAVYQNIANRRLIKKYNLDPNEKYDDSDIFNDLKKYNYLLPSKLNEFSENAVTYMSGFVVRKILKRNKCERCKAALVLDILHNDINDIIQSPIYKYLKLTLLKTNGGLILPSQSVVTIALKAEQYFRRAINCNGGAPPREEQFQKLLCCSVFRDLVSNATNIKQIFPDLNDHLYDDSFHDLSTHIFTLTKTVIEHYIELRIKAHVKNYSLRLIGLSDRNYTHRTIMWKHQ